MKRFHAHVRVDDLESSVRFYSMLFGTEPAVLKADYAKWMLDDPRVNFAITAGSTLAGLDHLGIQVESDEDLAAIAERLNVAGRPVVKQANAACCCARGNKGWVADPSGISWETFHTFGESTVYGNDVAPRPVASNPQASDSCCAPAPASTSACCSASKAQECIEPSTDDRAMANREYNVLFLCTGNSARSVMAECAINRWGKEKFRGFSAGSHPKGAVHPLTLELLNELNYETKDLRSKSWDEFAAPDSPRLDFVFTVCDRAAAERCPFWPGQPITAHWGVADPAAFEGNDAEKRRFFFRIYRELENRIKIFTSLRIEALDSFALQQSVREIGRIKLPD